MASKRLADWLFAAGLPAAAAGIGSVASRRAPQVYGRLQKPSWAPPAEVFGPVWTTLYALIGVAGWRLRTRGQPGWVQGLHAGQLALNAAWPWAFFGTGHRRTALAIVTTLDGAVATELAAAGRKDATAAALLSPYLLWCLYATALNKAVSDPGNAGTR